MVYANYEYYLEKYFGTLPEDSFNSLVVKASREIDNNIFKALDNVNLNCVLGTKKDGEYKSFLNDYYN